MSQKKVLMLGWEFPPLFSGGLGVVTYNLATALVDQGADLTLLLPQFIAQELIKTETLPVPLLCPTEDITQRISENRFLRIETLIHSPYVTTSQYKDIQTNHEKFLTTTQLKKIQTKPKKVYGDNLFQEIDRFAQEAVLLTRGMDFELVHAHDWITAEAALQLKIKNGLPYVLHIHATEVDRSGNKNPDTEVFRREKHAMEQADRVLAVSAYTKRILVESYGIAPEKISVVHNAYERKKETPEEDKAKIWKKDKSQFWVLFIGRVTLQKGPEYFLDAAKKSIPHNPNLHFFIAGDGDMLPEIQSKIKTYGLEENVHCLGFITPEQRDALYMFSDACIIPSVSEPFGLTAIEVIDHGTPLIISKNCGANEIIHHKLEVDYWDSDKMAEYVLALAQYPELRRTLRNKALEHRERLTWEAQAARVIEIYNRF